MSHIEVTDATIGEVLANNPVVVVDYWAEWCGPCQKFRPQFHAAASDYDAQFATGLIDENVEGVTALGVTTIPAVVVYKDGEVVGMRSGALDRAQLDDILTDFGVSPSA